MVRHQLVAAILLIGSVAFAQTGDMSRGPGFATSVAGQRAGSSDMFGFNRLEQILNTFPMQLGRTIAGKPSPGVSRSYVPSYAPIVGAIPAYWGAGYQPNPQPSVTVYTVPAPPANIVINNNTFTPVAAPDRGTTEATAGSTVKVYTAPPHHGARATAAPSAESSEEPSAIYLIAFKNGSLVSAYAYWVKDGEFYCVTTHNARKQVPLSQVDAEFSERLNRERGVEFQLTEE